MKENTKYGISIRVPIREIFRFKRRFIYILFGVGELLNEDMTGYLYDYEYSTLFVNFGQSKAEDEYVNLTFDSYAAYPVLPEDVLNLLFKGIPDITLSDMAVREFKNNPRFTKSTNLTNISSADLEYFRKILRSNLVELIPIKG